MQAVVLIPSLNPDMRLIELVDRLIDNGMTDIILVNDGSNHEYDKIFDICEQKGCIVEKHAINLGKGRGLKTGINSFLNRFPDSPGIVTADADGQHSVEDIMRLSKALCDHPQTLILGARDFSQSNVPFKSRAGNKITRAVFGYLSGLKLRDTQTGLRAIPRLAMPWMMELKGERFEYEMNMLIECSRHELNVKEIPIDTIYLEGNKSSHFNPFRDAIRIYSLLLKFAAASLSSSFLDLGIFALLTKLILPASFTESIAVATVVARSCSTLFNYTLNRIIVFGAKNKKGTVVRYYTLAVIQMLCSLFLVRGLVPALKWDEVLTKFIVDFILFLLSFKIQQKWVFGKTAKSA